MSIPLSAPRYAGYSPGTYKSVYFLAVLFNKMCFASDLCLETYAEAYC
jgi:hypothetical protein